MLSPDRNTSKRLYFVTAFAAAVFLFLFSLQLRASLSSGQNLTPLHVLITTLDGRAVNDAKITVVTRWSQLELTRTGNLWGFPDSQIRPVPKLVVTFPSDAIADDHQLYISTETTPSIPKEHPSGSGWTRVPLIPEVPGSGLKFQAETGTFGKSLILGLINRQSMNWNGDFAFIATAAVVPFTRVFFFWLLAGGFLWFRGEMKAASAGPKPQELSKTPNGGSRVDGLDHVRGIAILMVYAYHCLYATFGYDQLGWNGWFRNFDHDSRTFLALAPVTFGFGGVAIFFALSGFCIHLSYQRSRDKSWMTYLWRRLFRIYPPFLTALLFFAFFFPLTRVDFSYNGLSRFYSCLFLYFNLNLTPDTYWTINGSFWSVAVEIQLYLVYPLLFIAARHIGWQPVLWIAFLIEIGLKFPSSELSFLAPSLQFPFALQMGPFGYVFSWLIGAKLADDFLSGRALTFRRVPMLVWFSLLTLSLTFQPAAPFQFVLFSLTTVGIIARCVEGKVFRIPIPEWLKKHVAWVGMISYSVYLLHQPFLNLAPSVVRWMWSGNFVHPAIGLLSCLTMYPLILGLSWLMYRFVELPSISAGKWFVSRRTMNTTKMLNSGSIDASGLGARAS